MTLFFSINNDSSRALHIANDQMAREIDDERAFKCVFDSSLGRKKKGESKENQAWNDWIDRKSREKAGKNWKMKFNKSAPPPSCPVRLVSWSWRGL